MINNSQLVPSRAIYNILGSMCIEPKLLIGDGVSLTVDDFGNDLYKILFSSINNIIMSNVSIKRVTAIDVDNILSNNVKLYKVYEANNGFEFLNNAINDCNTDLFLNNYEIIKKFSLLRDLNDENFGVEEIFNPNDLDFNRQSKKSEELERMSLQDIICKVSTKLLNIKEKHNTDQTKKSFKVSHGLETLIEDLAKSPDYGHPFMNKYYNTIFMGMKYGKYMVKSAGTGVGKTRTALTDIVSVSASHIYDMANKCYVPNGIQYCSTFISTELEIRDLQTCLLAIISGINEKVIKQGNYDSETYTRINQAIEILKNSPIYLHYISDFSMSDIEQIIEKDILEHNTKFVFFDYLQITPKLSRTVQEEYGMGLREDQIMSSFSSRLKTIAERYNVYVSTATQLNRNSNDRDSRDASSIRGGSATIDKADMAIQLYKVQKKDLNDIEHIIKHRDVKPNFMHIIYKNRLGENNLIVWTEMNHGNMREKILFVTNSSFELVDDIKPIDIIFEK